MSVWEAPAKLNLSLQVRPPGSDGFHPLRSLVQTLDWCDVLTLEAGDDDLLVVEPDIGGEEGDNLVWKAIRRLTGSDPRPRIEMHLTKEIPVAAGLGGGSSDAAAALLAVADLLGIADERVADAAADVGSDVPFFLTGGTAWMEGRGERITTADSHTGFAVAVVVPPFELATPAVYRQWDTMDFPTGSGIGGKHLPPALRHHGELVNDLLPAAMALAPELGDWMADLGTAWGRPVAMSGSGPSLYAYFPDADEAAEAAGSVSDNARGSVGCGLRRHGAARLER